MKFGPLQLHFFKADEGAYSIVTADERDNSQVTLVETDGESTVALNALGASNIPRKAAKSNPMDVYVRSGNGNEVLTQLTINYPKSSGNELRIYRNVKKGFSYETGDVWFVYRRNKNLFVGAMPESAWRSIGREDPDDENFLQAVYNFAALTPALDKKKHTSYKYPRNAKRSFDRLELSGFRCEAEPEIKLFKARTWGKPYVEAHHLIPLSLQNQFKSRGSLDHLENIYALSPHHHRRIHLGAVDEAADVIDRLLHRRQKVLKLFGVSKGEVFRFYNCEKIL